MAPEHFTRRLVHAWAALICVLFLAPVPSSHGSGTVTNCAESDLRLALIGGGSVTLTCDSIISLGSPILVAKPTVIDATGHTPTLSSSGLTNASSIFIVQPGASLVLRHLTLSNGRILGANGTNGSSGDPARGAAIFNDHGSVTLDGCTLSGHSVTGGVGSDATTSSEAAGDGGNAAGAAVFNLAGQLTVTNSTFSGNAAVGGSGGAGAVSSNGGNGSSGGNGGNGGNGSGAAIYNAGNGLVTIFSSLFTSNTVAGSSAGLGAPPSGLLGFPGDSGASGDAFGAALFNESGTMAVVDSTFLANGGTGATGNPGMAGTSNESGTAGTSGGLAQGGGIFNGGTVLLTNCTFAANSLQGGPGGAGGSGQTFGFGGDGASGGSGGAADGGGICTALQGTTLIVNCTFSDNSLAGGTGGPGGAGSGFGDTGNRGRSGNVLGAALFNQSGTVRLKNSILASSVAGGNAGGTIVDEGFNLSSDATPVFNTAGSRNGIDPLLDSLTAAGGLVPTLTLASNSPAINAITAGDGNGCPIVDQRNALRVPPCDIGAYEFDGTFAPLGLQARISSGQLLLSWPAVGGFLVQTTADLSQSNSWVNVPGQSTTSSGLQTLSLTPSNPTAFFRLAP